MLAALSQIGQIGRAVVTAEQIGAQLEGRTRRGALGLIQIGLQCRADDVAGAAAGAGREQRVPGGPLAGQILACMEAALNRKATEYSRYGSTTHKQVYLYGALDMGPTTFRRTFGMAWGMGGWLLFPFLQKIGPEAVQALKARVAAELKTTFASSYTKEISLAEALQLDAIAVYGQRATGTKFLINPNRAS